MSTPLSLVHTGKVRDLYDAGDGLLLMVASDRISAYDVVFAEAIPEKGRVLTAMTAFWVDELADVAPGTVLTADPEEIARRVPAAARLHGPGWTSIDGRALLVRRAEMLAIECIARGFLAGQAYEEYVASGTVHGSPMPAGLRLADRLPEPIFTPSTKAVEGHDLNIGFEDAAAIVGRRTAEQAREITLHLYERAPTRAGCGRQTRSCRVGPRQPSTSSPCATGRHRADGTSGHRRPRSLKRWCGARRSATSPPTSG